MSIDLSLERAIQALRADDRETARALLQQLTQADPLRADNWLWLAAAHDDPAQKRACLQQVLTLNPNEQRAVAGLRALDQQPDSETASDAVVRQFATESATTSAEPEVSAATPKLGRLAQPRFMATGVRARRSIPWPIVAIAIALVLLIPLALWFLGQPQSPQALTNIGLAFVVVRHISGALVVAEPMTEEVIE